MGKATVLVVDDTPDNIELIKNILNQEYRVKAATNGQQALKVSRSNNKPDIILLDIMMPDMNGYEVCRKLKSDPLTMHIPVMFISAKTELQDEALGFELGAVDYITKPISPMLVKARVRAQLALVNQHRELEVLVKSRTHELEKTRLEIIQRLGIAAAYKDNETALHVTRMSLFTKLLAERYGANKEWVELVHLAAPMHDIGKIGIPDNILLKPGKLDKDEWEIMKLHSQYGAKILGNHDFPLLRMATDIALYHHEKWDGSGYPKGLIGDSIPLAARMAAIADVYDAVTTARPYKEAWPEERAIKLLEDGAGAHFDPELVKLFLSCLPDIRKVQSQHAEKHSAHE